MLGDEYEIVKLFCLQALLFSFDENILPLTLAFTCTLTVLDDRRGRSKLTRNMLIAETSILVRKNDTPCPISSDEGTVDWVGALEYSNINF